MRKQLKEVPTKTTNDKNTQTHTAVLPAILTVSKKTFWNWNSSGMPKIFSLGNQG